jgi:hypothetical protein
VEEIPFTAQVNHKIADAVFFEFDPAPDTFTAKAIRHAVTSPDGRSLFQCRRLPLEKGSARRNPERLTNEANLEFEPAFSPDGNTLAWVTWTDEELGTIKTLRLDRRRATRKPSPRKKAFTGRHRFHPTGNPRVPS